MIGATPVVAYILWHCDDEPGGHDSTLGVYLAACGRGVGVERGPEPDGDAAPDEAQMFRVCGVEVEAGCPVGGWVEVDGCFELG